MLNIDPADGQQAEGAFRLRLLTELLPTCGPVRPTANRGVRPSNGERTVPLQPRV